MSLAITWFVLWGVLWAVYFMLDGFVLGAGMLHHYLGRSDTERRILINSIGPVWDGNEVWLLTAGGATFAAFPTTYALMFSYLYTPLLLLLFALIIRGVAYEFRGKLDHPLWRRCWDGAILVGNFVPALLFGVAFGNIFAGLPMDAAGYHGSLLYLLNPYGLLTGALFVSLFLLHGALYVTVKTVGELQERALATARRLWPVTLGVAALFLAATAGATKLYDNYLAQPALFLLPLLAVAALLGVRLCLARQRLLTAFAASCATVLLVVAIGVTGLFPNLIPSNLNPNFSLTLYNSSSSPYTLKIMTVVALTVVPVVIAYKIWVYRIFRAPVRAEDVVGNSQAY